MRRLLWLLLVLSGSCAPIQKPHEPPETERYIIPLEAKDSALVCAMTPINNPFLDCLTVGQFRSIAGSVRADP